MSASSQIPVVLDLPFQQTAADVFLPIQVLHHDAFACRTQGVQAAQDEVTMMSAVSKLTKNPLLLELDWSDVEVGSMVGVGGFSRVFQATSHCIGDGNVQLAVKCLSTKTLDDNSRFQLGATDVAAEGEILSRLCHPNIVTLHAVSRGGPKDAFEGDDPRGYFLVLDLLSGGTLKTRLERFRKTEGRINKLGGIFGADSLPLKGSRSTMIQRLKTIALGVAKGLRYLHEQNVVLRDLKPDNIGFDMHGNPKIFDLGFAREIHTIKDGEVAGSFRYMAPEVALLGESSNNKVDVYSFGVVLWELLTLKKPFARVSQTHDEFVDQVYRNGYRPSTASIPSKAIRDLIKACWQADPDKRPSMEEVVEAIRVEITLANLSSMESATKTRHEMFSSSSRSSTPEDSLLSLSNRSRSSSHNSDGSFSRLRKQLSWTNLVKGSISSSSSSKKKKKLGWSSSFHSRTTASCSYDSLSLCSIYELDMIQRHDHHYHDRHQQQQEKQQQNATWRNQEEQEPQPACSMTADHHPPPKRSNPFLQEGEAVVAGPPPRGKNNEALDFVLVTDEGEQPLSF